MKRYIGRASDGIVVVKGNDARWLYPLDDYSHVVNYSPTGFAWGYVGSGPAQLALSLCMDYLEGETDIALEVYHHVCHHLIAKLDRDADFVLTEVDLREAIMDALDDLGAWVPTTDAIADDPRGG